MSPTASLATGYESLITNIGVFRLTALKQAMMRPSIAMNEKI